MALNFTRIVTGLKLKAKALLTSDSLGELEASTSDSKLHYHNGSVRSPVVTESSTATLTNKTIDANGTGNSISNLETADLAAGVLNTSTTLATASNTQIPSALAVKTYVDNGLALQNQAIEITYDNTVSGLIATNLQASTDEIVDMLDAHVTDPTDAHDATAISSIPSGNLAATDVQGALNELQSNIDTNYTAFTDHVNDAVDAHDASAISVTPTGNLAADDVQDALVELQTDIDNFSSSSTTFTNKNLDDSTVSFVDTVDATKKISFDAVGTTGTKTTITSSQTANRIITLPDATDTLVGKATTDTLTNKSLVDISTEILDSVDPTIKIKFDADGVSGTKTTLQTFQTADRIVLLPNASTTLVGDNNVQTITNKAFTDALNAFVDSSDPTKEIKFDAVGTTGTKTTIRSSQTADVVITLPNVTGTVVTSGDTGTVTSTMILNDTIVNADINTAAAIARSKLAAGTNNTIVANNGSGVLSDVSGITASAFGLSVGTTKNFSLELADDATTTGADASVAAFAGSALTFSNVGLTSIANIPAGSNGQELIIVNRVGSSVSIKDQSGAIGTASARIYTGTGADITLAANAALFLTYDSTAARWQIIGGSGGGGGGASALVDLTDVNILTPVNSQVLTYDSATSTWKNRPVDKEPEVMEELNFDYSLTTDFTQTGLAISTANPIRGLKSAQLISAGVIQSFKKVLAVDPEFRGKNNTLSIYTRSSATQGNVTILIYDETNAANLAASQAITLGSTTITATTTSASATLSAISTTDINLLKVGQTITGAGIPAGTIISAISTSTATMSQNASASATITPKISALPARQAFTFDIPNNCASISYTISALAETGSPESYFDDISIKLTERAQTTASVTVPKNNDTNWAPATFSTLVWQGLGTVTNNSLQVRRQGPNLLMRGRFTTGTVTGSIVQIPLPSNFGLLTTSASIGVNEISNAYFRSVANNSALGAIILQPSVSYFNESAAIASASNNPTTPLAGTPSYGSGEAVEIGQVSIPIQGWSANETESLTIPLTSSQLVQTPDSMIRLDTANGFGSTNTKIRRFTNLVANIGSEIFYVDSPTLGSSFTALESGVYSISYSEDISANSAIFGISLNTTQPNTNFDSITTSEKLASTQISSSASHDNLFVSWSGYLNEGDIIRPHTSGQAIGLASRVLFTMTKQGSLKQLNFSSDSKITIPTHQLRFEGASSRGSTDTAIVKFDTQAITQGDAWSVVNTAANGTVITMLKAGKLSVSTNLIPSGAGSSIQITKNQQTKTAISAVASEIMASSYIGIAARPHASSTFDVNIGDVIRVTAESAPSANVGNMVTLSLTESSIPANFSNVLPQWSQSDSSVQLRTANGYGSTATKIRRFSNTVNNLGTAITYTDSASDGASFTANEDGEYQISYSDVLVTSSYFGLTKNSAELTTNVTALTTPSALLAIGVIFANNTASTVSWQGYLAKGDVIRAHTNGIATGTDGTLEAKFSINKVGKPNLSSVDVTSFVNMKTTDTEAIEALTATSTFGSTNTGVPVLNITKNTNLGVIRVDSSAANGTSFVALKDCEINIAASAATNGSAGGLYLTRNSTVLTAAAPNGVFANIVILTTSTYSQTISGNVLLKAGDTVRIQKDNANINSISTFTLTAVADNNATASPTQQVSSDTMSFVFKATAIDPATDAVGTFNTYTYAGGTNTATIAGTAPTQTTSSMNINGIQVFGRAYNTLSTAASPTRVDVFIGKGLKSKQVDAYGSLAKVGGFAYDRTNNAAALELGTEVFYSETTGILSINAGIGTNGSFTTRYVSDFATSAASGYFVFNASKAPVLTTVPNLQMRVAYLSEQQPSGTNSTTVATAGTWCDRVLNTIVDSTGVVTSLASNTVTLQAGTYSVEGWATQYTNAAGVGKVRLRNTTDSITSVVGSSEYYGQGTQTFKSILRGEVTITSPKTFKLQTYFANTVGGGTAATTGDNELYASLVITKIK